jgi:hypothetical protein
MVPINYLAVIASTVAAMIVGFIWYGPLFGRYLGFSEPKVVTS